MKKLIYLMTAVIVTLAFNACSINDNPATPSNPSGRAVITVNTAAMYEEVDLVETIERNLSKIMCVSDTVLIYDQNGHLVKKVGTVTKSLEPLTIVADDLPNGTYTLVAWQTGYYDYETAKPIMLADEEELATVKLVRLKNCLLYAYANGLASATVTVNGNSFETTVNPKLVGSYITFKSEKACDEYSFDQLYLYRVDQATKGIYLDPARTEDNRWIMGYNENKPTEFAYLENAETEYLHYTLEQGDDVQLDVFTWTKVDGHWKSNRLVYAGHHKLQEGSRMVYYINVDRVTSQPPFCGPEDQLPAWKADRDAGKLVNDPYIKWGGNLAEVEAHKKAKQYWFEGNDQLESWGEYGWHYWYLIANGFTEQYLFKTEDGQNLHYVLCICYDETLSINDFNKSLQLQGYTYLGKLHYPNTEDYIDTFQSADEKTEAFCYADTGGGWVIQYAPFNPEDLNYIIPASLAPANSKVRSIVQDLRRGSPRNATMHNCFIKPMRTLKAHDLIQ